MQQQGLEPLPCQSSPQPVFSASYHAMPFWLELMQAFSLGQKMELYEQKKPMFRYFQQPMG